MTYSKFIQPGNRAYSTISLKSNARDDGVIIGIASTPELDRSGDVLMPEGAVFRLPFPLLWQHDHGKPIGNVTAARVSARGIEIVAKVAIGATEEIDRYYKLIRAGLVRGLSVGFRALEAPEVTRTGLLYRRWEILELSTVTVPCNGSASIHDVKAACGVQSVSSAIPLIRRSTAIKLSSKSAGVSIKLRQAPIRLIRSL